MGDERPQRFSRVLAGVLAVVEGPGGSVAFVEQLGGPYAGNWLLPGGGIEVGEPAEEAVIREVAEETGLVIAAPQLFALFEMSGAWEHGPYHLLMLGFRARTDQRVPEGFEGHNVGRVRQVLPGELPLHSTDLVILQEAGIATFGADEIRDALARDGIRMRTYRSL